MQEAHVGHMTAVGAVLMAGRLQETGNRKQEMNPSANYILYIYLSISIYMYIYKDKTINNRQRDTLVERQTVTLGI